MTLKFLGIFYQVASIQISDEDQYFIQYIDPHRGLRSIQLCRAEFLDMVTNDVEGEI